LDKAKVDITQRLPDPPWPLPRHYQASFGHYQDTLATATSNSVEGPTAMGNSVEGRALGD